MALKPLSKVKYNLSGAYRLKAIELLGGQCRICGRTDKLQIHHKNKDWTDNHLENLQLLCKPCHWAFHGKNHLSKTELTWFMQENFHAN